MLYAKHKLLDKHELIDKMSYSTIFTFFPEYDIN